MTAYLSHKESTENYIVAIGASAGGLEAIHEFFDNMPPNDNLSFIIIQHLSPDYKSLLVELIAKHTHMEVLEADHEMVVRNKCVYVIPNNKLLTIKNGKLQLAEKVIEKAPNTAIDTLLRSLAQDAGPSAIAIILSGTGTDGSKGILEINKNGGLVLVQEPQTAKFDGMPNSALATGVADFSLPPALMPQEILNYIIEKPAQYRVTGKPTESQLPEVMRLVEKFCQHDFSNYKTPTILRRITRRMGQLNLDDFQDYIGILQESPEECRLLGKEFLIGVTKFFRDQDAFRLLQETVLTPLVRQKEEGDILKLWVVACSTGEEAYTMAILLDTILQKESKNLEVKIFASDIDQDAIEFASRATYDYNSLQELDIALLNQYFIQEGNKFTVNPRIRKQIVFARHNIIKDPPFIKNDLVSCRNMLIYMNTLLQRKTISTLQFALNNGGYLFLGPSEAPVNILDGFREMNGKWKIYQKIYSDNRFNPERLPAARQSRNGKFTDAGIIHQDNGLLRDLTEDFKAVVTEKYGFAALYIDKNFEIKEAIGNFRKYLALPDRIAALNILKMVSNELSVSLGAAIRKCIRDNKEVALLNTRIPGKQDSHVSIFIRPSHRTGQLLIVLSEQHENSQRPVLAAPGIALNHPASYLQELEEELKETRMNLQVAVESLETSNEELQSSNEELLSANEELQSSNEELQSLNEELHTLNTEHQLRIKELVELNDDLNNYFSSTEIAQVFVDGHYRIRKFNPAAIKMINLITSDIGRPIEHISTNLRNGQLLMDDIRQVVRTQQPLEREVELTSGRFNLMRILPYERQDKKYDGTVISFIDITNLKELNTIIRSVFNATSSAIMAFRAVRNASGEVVDLKWIAANPASDVLMQRSNEAYIGSSLRQNLPNLLQPELLEHFREVIEKSVHYQAELYLETASHAGWYEMMAAPMDDGMVISLLNIDEKKSAEEKLKHNYHELIRSKENYRLLNRELEEKVKERTQDLAQSEERFRMITNAISDAIWDRDLVKNHIWWSDSFYNWFGYPKEAATNEISFWMDAIHPDDRLMVQEAVNKAINEDEDWNIAYRIRKFDGNYIPVTDKGTVLRTEHGVPYRLLGAITDRTSEEIARQNEALRASNTELEALVQVRTAGIEAQKTILHNLFQEAPAMICTLTGPQHHISLANPSFRNIVGKKDLVGKTFGEAFAGEAFQSFLPILDKVFQTGETYTGREVSIYNDRYLNIIFQATRDENRQINGILLFAYEVTDQVSARNALQEANDELVKLNQEFKFVTDFMPQLVWVTQPDGYHIYYNKGWYEYTGLTPEQSMGSSWNGVLHPEDRHRAWKVWNAALEKGDDYEIEYRFRRHDGTYRWFLGRALPMKDENGVIVKWFGTCTDIHDQKRMSDVLESKVKERTEELRKINMELESRNNELLQFASIASHDLKEPLRKISMFSNLVKDRHHQELSEGALLYVDKIIASSTRMAALVNDLLSFTRLSSESKFERGDLNHIVAEVLSDLELVIAEKDALVKVDELPVVEMVPGYMRQVFQNIISNALKFSKAGERPEIRICSAIVKELSFNSEPDPGGHYCRIRIQDNGIGFDNIYAEKIFTIFQRLHSRNEYEGTGIGLAIARKIIARHRGIIQASSVAGQGASFEIVIPLEQVKD